MDNILLFIKLPPPITGATIVNKYVSESHKMEREFCVKIIPASYKKDIADYKILSPRKIVVIISLLYKLIKSLIFFKPKIVYFQISPLGIAFYRDLLFILIIRFSKSKILYHIHGKGIHEVIENTFLKKKLYKWA
jgi:hypothetical protein